jgi:Rps23 Pro-64 3,4-dihydroxylase Tpa1-like proline 4-hydroxylase
VLSTLHTALVDPIAELQRQFATAQPFRHVVIDRFLDPAFCQELIDAFPPFAEHAALNEYGELGGKATVANIASLGPAYRGFDDLMKDPQFLALTGRVTGIPDLLYDPEYVGGGTHDNRDGQELDVHVDFNYHPSTQLHRRLNLILFLNPEWEESWGGCLELLQEPFAAGDGVKTVVPVANRAVIFETTEASWHGFRRIVIPKGKQVSRRSIAVYFYTKERPPEQTAPSHATVYYQRPLSAHIKAGYTLRPEDVLELQILLTRRDTYLKFLYERELDFSQQLAGRDWRIGNLQARERELLDEIAAGREYLQAINDSPSLRLGKALTWPVRKIRSLVKDSE